jgi:hypothetical protein
MSFLDKALKVAAVAKDHFDETRHRPLPASAPDAHEQQVLRRALALGAPDPTALLSLEEAAEVAGVPLGGPRLTYSDDALGVEYAATGPRQQRWSVAVQAFHAPDEDTPYDAAVHWHTFVAPHIGENDGVAVPGLGDAALARDGEIHVLAEPLLFSVTVRRPDDPAPTEPASRAARQVLARVR